MSQCRERRVRIRCSTGAGDVANPLRRFSGPSTECKDATGRTQGKVKAQAAATNLVRR